MANSVKWKTYEFQILKMDDTTWNAVGGVYIFTGIRENVWRPFYVGQTDSFKNRMPSHERWDEARILGATHVHAMSVQQAVNRDAIERDLIQSFNPLLNAQHK